MSVEIEYSKFKQPAFLGGLRKISNYPGFKPPILKKVVPFLKNLKVAEKASEKEWTEELKPFAVKDDKGEIASKIDERGQEVFDILDGKQDDLQKAFELFGKRTAEIEVRKFSVEELEGVGLNPNEFLALEPFIHGLEVIAPEGDEDGKVESIKKTAKKK